MEKSARDFLNTELEYFQKAAEIQFTHFMRVFYFWTVVVTAPITAGLLVEQNNPKKDTLYILLFLIAIIGWFLAAKMYDIRCSQLRYISHIDYVRETIYKEVEFKLTVPYKLPFSPSKDFQMESLKDFGLIMALTMSFIHSLYFGFGIPFLLYKCTTFDWLIFWDTFALGVFTYVGIILWRLKDIKRPTQENTPTK